MFSVSIKQPTEWLQVDNAPEPLESESDYDYLVIYACSALSRTNCEFRIGGFGNPDWNFNISYDMSAFMEGLPDLLEGVRGRGVFQLDLYPEGVERTLTFEPQGEVVRIICDSRTTWHPNPSVETVPRGFLESMLKELAHKFAKSVEFAAPEVAVLSPFAEWLRKGSGSPAC